MTNMTYAVALDNAMMVLDAYFGEDVTMTETIDHEAVREKLEALKAQLAKRGSAKTPTKTQKENEIIMTNILDALADIGEPTTVTDLIAHGIEGFELTNQKVSALLRKLVERGKVTKTIEGKKAMFALA
jgi:DNA-binding transcriptional ArsR family regulator